MIIGKQLFAAALLCATLTGLAQNSGPTPPPNYPDLPPLETFVLAPMQLEHLAIWIPADKTGPTINRSCRTRTNCQYTCTLPATVEHGKSDDCLAPQARLLAEWTAPLCQDSLPLTIFNGWQWEYRYSMAQFETFYYDLRYGGGSWENSLEAVRHRISGNTQSQWLQMEPNGHVQNQTGPSPKSQINITTYSSIRTRHGYPKERLLEQ